MKTRIFTLLTYFVPGAICVVIARLSYYEDFFEENLGFIDGVLFLLLTAYVFIASITKFRDSSKRLIPLKKTVIPKLHVAIVLFLFPLLLLNGTTSTY